MFFFFSFAEPHQLQCAGHQRHASRLPQVFERRNKSRDWHPDPRFHLEPNQVKNERLVPLNTSENLPVAPSVVKPTSISVVKSSKVFGRARPTLLRRSEQRFRPDWRLRKRRILSFTDLGFGRKKRKLGVIFSGFSGRFIFRNWFKYISSNLWPGR